MIKVSNLTFSYDDSKPILSDVSFEIKKGSWISIVGHNGSGKSTLAKLLIGLLKASEGEIIVDNLIMNETNVYDIRKKIGIVFQNPDNQFVGVTVKHDIAFGLENLKVPHDEMVKRVFEYAKLVGMEDYLNKEPQNLSGGQKQRVAIAGALAMKKEILIFDEATSMLDPNGVNDVTKLIKDLNRDMHQTIITISHDLDFALKSDYCLILKDGKLIGNGKPEDLFLKKDLLESSKLTIPEGLLVYQEILKDPRLSKNKELLEALWEFNYKR